MSQSSKLPQYFACIAVTIGAFAAGTIYAWTSPTLPILTNSTDINIDDNDGSWVAGIMSLGAASMTIPMGFAVDMFGLKWPMMAILIPFIAGWVVIASSNSLVMYLIGRFLTGMGGGGFSLAAPVYVGEVAEKDIRGTLGSLFQLMVTTGILFVYVVGNFTSVMVLSIICGCVPIVFGLIFFFMPESPQVLLKKGRKEDAEKSLQWLRGRRYDVTSELHEMETIVLEAERKKASFKDVFATPTARRAIFISFGLMIFQQLSGVNAVIFFTVDIFKSAGSTIDPNTCSMIVGAVQMVATFISSLIVDKLGRRFLLLLSDIVMTICQILLGVFFYLNDDLKEDTSDISWLPLLSVIVFITSFSLGYGPIPWMMLGELFPPEIKGKAGSLSCFLNWILTFIVTKFFVDLKNAFGSAATFWIFAGICAIGTVFVFFFVIETKGKTLDEIQLELAGKKPKGDGKV